MATFSPFLLAVSQKCIPRNRGNVVQYYILVHILAAEYRTNIANSVPAKTVSLVEKYLYLGYVLVARLITRSDCIFSLDHPHRIFPNQKENWTALT